MQTHRIILQPGGKVIIGSEGETIKKALEQGGIPFPNNCGGKGKCLSCRIEFTDDAPLLSERETKLFDRGSNCRMACQHTLKQNIDITISGYEFRDDIKRLDDFGITGGGVGYGIAVDLGTTLVALYLIDLQRGEIVSQHSFLNPQMLFGGDVMSRLTAAKDENRRKEMTHLIHRRVAEVIDHATKRMNIERDEIKRIFVAGNSVMSHLWLGVETEGLERAPFRSSLEGRGITSFGPSVVGLNELCVCEVSPVLAGFVGGDITAAILAADLDSPPLTSPPAERGGEIKGDSPPGYQRGISKIYTPPGFRGGTKGGARLLIDLGTNGEIVLSSEGRMLATSTAAGPAFEGVGMLSGMAALPGAIEGFTEDGEPITVGGEKPVGFCGSGYIAALDLLLRKGILSPSGLLCRNSNGERHWSPAPLSDQPPYITQDDVRKFQLGKGAIAAGVELLCAKAGIEPENLDEVILTGSFGNRVDIQAAINLGLLPKVPVEKVIFMDNAAGRGAALCLGNESYRKRAEELQHSIEVINLGDDPDFEDRFIANMQFLP